MINTVMAGLVPAIHVVTLRPCSGVPGLRGPRDVDGRDKPGHDVGSGVRKPHHPFTCARAASSTASGVKPNLSISLAAGALAPKVCMAISAPVGPT